MEKFNGILIYEILENGNLLNGVYTNDNLRFEKDDDVNYNIENEIARKLKHDNNGVDGLYSCRYIETNNLLVIHCDLKIIPRNGVYELIWTDTAGVKWTGLGLKVGSTHIAVSYDGV